MKLLSRAAIILVVAFTLAAFASHSVVFAKEAKSSKKQSVAQSKKKLSTAQIKMVQQALSEAGYKIKVDGKMGRQLRAALKKYQKKNGLKVTGRIDKATLEKVGSR
jgi:peptidoglycan hydrolase-like protein with peptidoglycan-binding domain